jgi:hypothetical protein
MDNLIPVLNCPDVITKYHKLGGLANRNLLLHCPGGQSPRSRCPWDWFLLRTGRENQLYASLLASVGSLVIFGVP